MNIPARLNVIRRWAIALAAGLFISLPTQAAEPTKLVVRPGASVVLAAGSCLRPVVPAAGNAVEIAKVADTKYFAIYTAPRTESGASMITIEAGDKENAAKNGCEPATQKQFSIGSDSTPLTPASVLNTSFTILVSAFVLAVLLESAFALLFNWRLFLEFFVGKAWRTPIMFVAALVVVRAFHLDLMSSLFDAYAQRPDGVPSSGSWFTSALTAMILAGGSVGVNQILVTLGFRSQIRSDSPQTPLKQDEAWISVLVTGKKGDIEARVDVEEVLNPQLPNLVVPTVVGILSHRGVLARLRGLFFPSRTRLPASGGRTVSTDKVYRITVYDLRTNGNLYDAMGHKIENIENATPLRFGPRAVVDFEVSLPATTSA